MTLDQDPVDPEIIDLLKGDARIEHPPGLDQRVASRLAASAGIFGLGTAVTAGSQAAAVSAASTTAAATTAASAVTVAAAPAVKLITLGSLGKMLALGMALGSTVGLGLHVTFRHVDAPVSRPARVASVAATAPLALPTVPSRSAGNAELLAPVIDAGANGTAAPELARVTQPVEPHTNPAPELPGEASRSARVGLAAQQMLLDDARAALRRGDGVAALAAIRRHGVQFPSTAFEEEREAVAIKALVLVGKVGEARNRTQRFEARFPKSLLTPSLRPLPGTQPSGVDSMTDGVGSSQTTSEQ